MNSTNAFRILSSNVIALRFKIPAVSPAGQIHMKVLIKIQADPKTRDKLQPVAVYFQSLFRLDVCQKS